MDKRSLLLGLGMGMIVGAILMQLFLIGEQTSSDIQNKDEAINGIQAPIFSSSPEADNNNTTESDNPKQEEAINTNTKDSETEVTPTPVSDNQINSESELRESSDQEKFPNTLLLRVYSGATVSQTAEVLLENEIIEDKDAFVSYVRSKAKQFRAGYFFINRHLTNDQALKILSGKPLSEEEASNAEQSQKYDIIFSP